MDRSVMDLKCQQLIGHKITKVFYYEINYEDEEYWNWDPRFDSLDFGLDIETQSGECFSIGWGDEFFQYGISVNKESLAPYLREFCKIDVSNTERWEKLIGKEIVAARLVWEHSQYGTEKVYYPQDLIFSLSNKQEVFVSALEITDGNSISGMTNHITVFFDREIARHFKVDVDG